VRRGAYVARSGAALYLVLTVLLCVACDSTIAFFIQNETDELHYVRVTVNRTGRVYVHHVEPRTSGFATRGVVPGPGDQGDVYTVELLDAACNPIAEWGMPSTGGYLKVSGAPEFLPGYYAEDPPSPDGTGEIGASEPPDGLRHVTVLRCGATDTLP
jgi:hypothetical protein